MIYSKQVAKIKSILIFFKLFSIYTCQYNFTRVTVQLITPLMLCMLILYLTRQTYSLKSTPNYRFLRNFLCLFWYLTWGLNRDFTSNKPTHYLIYYSDCEFNTLAKKTSLIHYLMRGRVGKGQSRANTEKLLVSILVVVCDSYSFCDWIVYVESWRVEY